MTSTSFKESNHVLDTPKGSQINCDALSVFVGQTDDQTPVVVSCWKLTKDEIDDLLKTGRLWCIIVGQTMPPITLTTVNPFS